MMLIADSGSTKTEWALVKDTDNILFFRTEGYNPYFDRQITWKDDLAGWLRGEGMAGKIGRVYYYGAGCNTGGHANLILDFFRDIMPAARTEVYDDLTGAARALFGREKGVAVILGTGTNAGFWDGVSIIRKDIALGYLLGDHGSGAVLGLRLMKAWLDHELPDPLGRAFKDRYHLDLQSVKEEIYRSPRPNYYLAQFSPFLQEHKTDHPIRSIIMDEFRKLIRIQVKPLLDHSAETIRCTGSIAFYFRDLLAEAAGEEGLKIDRFLQYPLEGLLAYHKQEIL